MNKNWVPTKKDCNTETFIEPTCDEINQEIVKNKKPKY